MVKESVRELIKLLDEMSHYLDERVTLLGEVCFSALRDGKKIIAFGNGGSAADASHFVAELVVRFRENREAIRAISLAADICSITAISNDFGYENSFSRQLEAIIDEGDIVLGISTSGKSRNVLNALKLAQSRGGITLGLIGSDSVMAQPYCNYLIEVPSKATARIQEAHTFIAHCLAEVIEVKFARRSM